MLTTIDGAAILTPEQVSDLLVRPAFKISVAGQLARVITTDSKSFRVPVVQSDPTAAWVAEGAEINPSDAAIAEVIVTPSKVAGLSIITRELADDSTPEAAQVVGDGLARDVARRVDEAFFGNLASPAPAGLGSLATVSTVAAPTEWADVDPFEAAIFAAEAEHANVTAWAANPADALALAELKEATGSNKGLLQPDVTTATRRAIAGRPLLVSPYVTAGTVWGVPSDRVLIVVRDDAEVTADRSVYFTSDRVAIKGTMRVGYAFPHPAAIVKIVRAAAPVA